MDSKDIDLKKIKLTKRYTKKQLMKAIKAVNKGTLTAREASQLYKVPISTIHVKAKEARRASGQPDPGKGIVIFLL